MSFPEIWRVATEFLTFSQPTGMRPKLLVIHGTSLPPSVAKTRPVRKLENAEKLVKKRSSFRNARRSSE